MKKKKHKFSGWSGAYCVICGAPDPHEEHFDWWKIKPDGKIVYDSKAHEEQIKKEMICTLSV